MVKAKKKNKAPAGGKLNERQQRFVEAYLKNPNATEAYIQAGYTKKGAEVSASKLLRIPKVVKALNEARKERSKRTKIDADWILEHCAKMLEADIGDILNDLGQFKPIHEWPKIWRQMLSGADIKELTEWNGAENRKEKIGELVKAKFVSREKILELTGKHVQVGAFADKVEHSGELEIKGIDVRFVSDGKK